MELQEASPRLGKVLGAEQDEGDDSSARVAGDASTTPRTPAAGDRKAAAGSKRVIGHPELTNSVLPPSEPRPVASRVSRLCRGNSIIRLLLPLLAAQQLWTQQALSSRLWRVVGT